MQDTNEMQNVQNEQPPIPQNPSVVHDGMSPEEKRAESYKIRLSKARQEAEEEAKRADKLKKELDDLKKKFESGKATTNEASDYVTTENVINKAHQDGIHPDAIPGIIEDHMARKKLTQSLEVAVSKDKELAELMNDPSSQQKISPDELLAMKYLDNAPAVFKHLLKNDNDRMVLKAAEQAFANGDGGVAFYTHLNNLSEKLKKTASYPHPTKFKETPDLSDVGDSEVFDTESYIKSKYR
jgi:hypothetical protein